MLSAGKRDAAILFTFLSIVPVALKVKVAQIGALPNNFAHYTTAAAGTPLYCYNIVQLAAAFLLGSLGWAPVQTNC